ncbi:arylsulfotransferase family protein, partial [bacterium]|nr:arylsulfotransferase family protein [bacterium]
MKSGFFTTILFSILFAIVFGALVRHEMLGGIGLKSIGLGWISKTALFLAEIPSNAKRIFNNDNLLEDRFPSLDGFNGTPNSQESFLLLSRYDGDLNESVVELVDLKSFDILHTWNPDIDAFNDLVEQVDEFKYLKRDSNNNRSRLRHPKLLQDGHLLFQDDTPLRKIDDCSNLVFQNTHDIFHHSIETDIDGNIWVPSYIYPQSISKEKVVTDIIHDGG